MYDRILRQMREKTRTRQYMMTIHEIERIKLHRESFAQERPVSVAVFA
jgi:hypothetical protein